MSLRLRTLLVAIALTWTLPASAAVSSAIQPAGHPDASPLTWVEPDEVAIVAAGSPFATTEEVEESEPAPRFSAPIAGIATHYGVSYQGQVLGCSGEGRYSTYDPTIAAVDPARYREWPCGTQLRLTGPGGSTIVTRRDSCPGCSPSMIDLSDAANMLVCGDRPHTCRIEIEVLL